MSLRIAISTLVLPVLLASAPAQETRPQQQDPDIAGPKPPSNRLAELQKEKDRLVQEIGYVRQLLAKGGLVARVAAKLKHRVLEPRAVDAGASQRQTPVLGMEPRRATLMTEEQKAKYLPDVLFTVENRPVRKAAFDELYEYLKSANPDLDDKAVRGRVVLELIQTEYAHASFAKTAAAAATKIREIEAAIGRGVEFEHLARNRSQHPSAENGGDLGFITHNSGHPLKLEQVAFSTEVGSVSPVFKTSLGYNILRVTEAKDTDAGKAVRVSLILIPYIDELDEVQEIQRNVSLGQVNLVFRDEELRQVLPPMFR